MKAIQLRKDSSSSTPEIVLDDVPPPKVVPGYILIKVIASAIQPSDVLNSQGGFPLTKSPRVPGRDFFGTVIEPPSRSGEEVFGTGGAYLGFDVDGAHADYALIPEDLAITKPGSLSPIQAAAVGVPFTTALLCLTRARTSHNDVVLVLGANGAVGSAATQIARALGCKRVLRAARGSTSDIDTSQDSELNTIKALTDGKGVDVIVDTVGNLALMDAGVNHLAERGRYTFVSAPHGSDAERCLRVDTVQMYRKEIEIIGCNSAKMNKEEVKISLALLKTWFESGSIVAVDEERIETISLSQASESYQSRSKKIRVITTS